jgi:hypothetical protein
MLLDREDEGVARLLCLDERSRSSLEARPRIDDFRSAALVRYPEVCEDEGESSLADRSRPGPTVALADLLELLVGLLSESEKLLDRFFRFDDLLRDRILLRQEAGDKLDFPRSISFSSFAFNAGSFSPID